MIGFQSSCSDRWPPSCSRKDEPPEIVALYEAAMKKPAHLFAYRRFGEHDFKRFIGKSRSLAVRIS